MTKILYHGSPLKFEQFDIKKSIENSTTHIPVEGNGIYLTENKEIAKSYGRYLYEVHYSYDSYKDSFFLSWDMEELQELIKKFAFEAFNDSDFFIDYIGQSQITDICQGVIDGDLSIMKLNDELCLWLDCNGFWFEDDERLEYDSKWESILPPVVEYYDKSFDSYICICHKDTERLVINNITDLSEKVDA